MKKELFDQLLESIKEAGAIARGELKPPRAKKFAAVDPRGIREKFGVTQLAFSRMIGVSLGTLRNWEQGRRMPHGPARVLLLVAAKHPALVRGVIQEHRRGIAVKAPDSNVLSFATAHFTTPRRPAFTDAGYVAAKPVGVGNLAGEVSNGTSTSA